MASRSPQQRHLLMAQGIGPAQEFGTTGNSIANMIDALLPLNKQQGMMIVIAAQPRALTQQPIGDIKSQGLGVELDQDFQARGIQGNMLQTIWPEGDTTVACRRSRGQ